MKHFLQELEQLTADLLEVAALVEESMRRAIRALDERKADLAQSVIAGDDAIDREEVRIEEECVQVLALSFPVAGDLRRVIAVLKINNDLERIADLAVDIAQESLGLVGAPEPLPIPVVLVEIEALARQMVHDSLNAFVHSDAQLARTILAMDDEVDRLKARALNELKAMIRADPGPVDAAFHFASVARQLERIADHASNIAEDVVYLIEGEVIRHRTATGG